MDSQRVGQGSYTQLGSDDPIVSQLAQQDRAPWYMEITSGYDASMMNGLQAVPSWLEYYHNPHSASLGLMTAMYSLGSVAAVPFAPFVVDKIGRRYSILLGGVMSVIGGVLQGSALNFTMFILARFILGFANVFSIVAASSLIAELSHPKERAVLGCLFNNSWDVGAISAAGVTLATFAMPNNWGWRIPSLLQALPSLIQVSFIWFLPESPRWLISRGRGNEAYATLVKYHAEGDENSDFAKAEFAQIEQTLEAELKTARISQGGVYSTPGMRKRVIVTAFLGLFVQWSGVGLISQYLSLILDSIGIHDNHTKNIINLSRFSWSLVNGTVASLAAPRYPRRGIYLTSTTSIFLVFTAWTVTNAEYSFTRSKVSAKVVLFLIFLYSPAYNLAFTALTYTYLVELFPFYTRARGISTYHWWSRGGAFFSLFVNPIGMDIAGWRWYIIYCVWNAFQVLFVYTMFPETSGRTLEELAFLYEGDREASGDDGDGVGVLRTSREVEAYGTMGDHPRRIAIHEQE